MCLRFDVRCIMLANLLVREHAHGPSVGLENPRQCEPSEVSLLSSRPTTMEQIETEAHQNSGMAEHFLSCIHISGNYVLQT